MPIEPPNVLPPPCRGALPLFSSTGETNLIILRPHNVPVRRRRRRRRTIDYASAETFIGRAIVLEAPPVPSDSKAMPGGVTGGVGASGKKMQLQILRRKRQKRKGKRRGVTRRVAFSIAPLSQEPHMTWRPRRGVARHTGTPSMSPSSCF
jgi:hypothetical protein